MTSALADLRGAACSAGAPSARNLLVTVFGDALLPHGADTVASVASLAELLSAFGVNERLVRTSLTRLANDGLLTARQEGRRSFYGVAPDALDLFVQADRRIYVDQPSTWDGSWTIVVVDANESTPRARARLRQELAWAGLGTVAPNVMASPVVPAAVAASVVAHVGGFDHVLVSRSQVVEGPGTLDADELARRAAPLDDTAHRYRAFVERFEQFGDDVVASLSPADAFKLRTLLIASFRRIVLADPLLPEQLLPADWIGASARDLADSIYRRVAESSERFLIEVADPPLLTSGADPYRFTGHAS